VWTEKTDVEEKKDEEEEEGDLFLTPSGTQLLDWTGWWRKRERNTRASTSQTAVNNRKQ
jgi:hypothetical protein